MEFERGARGNDATDEHSTALWGDAESRSEETKHIGSVRDTEVIGSVRDTEVIGSVRDTEVIGSVRDTEAIR